MNRWHLLRRAVVSVLVLELGVMFWPKTGAVVRAAQSTAVQIVPGGQTRVGNPGAKGATYYALEAKTSSVTTRFSDGHVAVAARGLLGDVRTTLHDRDGNDQAQLRVNRVDGVHDTLVYEPTAGQPFQAIRPSGVQPTLDWINRQAYSLHTDGATNLEWQGGVMRPKGVAQRDVENDVTALETVWANGLAAKVRRQTYSRRELAPGRFVQGPALVTELTLNGVAAGTSVWFQQDKVFAYELPGLVTGLVYIAPEHLIQYGGWPFTPDMAWLNLQIIATHHFRTMVAKNGFVAKSCDTPQPNRLAEFFFPTAHANEAGCDDLHWLDGTILRGCCDDHDRCYSKGGCTSSSWWQFWTSWSCDFCNIEVVACFRSGGNRNPACNLLRLFC